jgi:hypothetical protein
MLLSQLDLKAARSGATVQETFHASLSLINPSGTGRSRNLSRYSAISASANSPVRPVHSDVCRVVLRVVMSGFSVCEISSIEWPPRSERSWDTAPRVKFLELPSCFSVVSGTSSRDN